MTLIDLALNHGVTRQAHGRLPALAFYIVERFPAAGGKRSLATRKVVIIVHGVDDPGVTCDPGEFSYPIPVNLKMEDDRNNILIHSSKTVVCGQGVTKNLKRNVFFRGPLNWENGAVPPSKPGFSTGTIAITGAAPLAPYYYESTRIKCFE